MNIILKDVGNGLYEISTSCAFFILFRIEEHLPVGEVVGAHLEIACCATECQTLSLSIDFTCQIVEINQTFIDYTRATDGKDLDNDTYKHTDWIYRVRKVSYKENKHDYFAEHKQYDTTPTTILHNTWYNYLKPYLSELGYFTPYLPLEVYVRNFQVAGKPIKNREAIVSFEYYPKYHNVDNTEKWVLAEKHKKLAYLYAPYDIETVTFNEKLLIEAQYNPQPNGWILMNCKEDFILKIERKIHYYVEGWHWYKIENDFIRVGLNTKQEYICAHLPCYPQMFAPVGKILKEQVGEYVPLAEFDIAGPMMVWLDVLFDMEVVEINPRIWHEAQMYQPCELLEKDCFGEGWLFVVKPLNPEKTREMFTEWYEKGWFA